MGNLATIKMVTDSGSKPDFVVRVFPAFSGVSYYGTRAAPRIILVPGQLGQFMLGMMSEKKCKEYLALENISESKWCREARRVRNTSKVEAFIREKPNE